MLRSRPAVLGAVLVGLLVLLVAAGLFVVQYADADRACSVVPGPKPCSPFSPPQVATDALFAAALGLALAVGLGTIAGVGWKRDPAPNLALAHQLEAEAASLQRYLARRAQLDEWTVLAQARAAERAAAEEAAAIAAEEEAQAEDAELFAKIGLWEEEAPEPSESEDQVRRRVLAEHLSHLARTKPEAVAEVLKTWINQSSR